jgi:hypothetical protein
VNKKKRLILELLDNHRLMTMATNRPDGWPQVTTVGYVNDGFLLYCFVARNSQKHANVLRDARVSIAIGSDTSRPLDIKALSLAARAVVVTDPREFAYVAGLRMKRYPEYAELPAAAHENGGARAAPQPSAEAVVLLRLEPELFSLIDYSQGFGHSDLVAFSERDLDQHLESLRHRWV